MNLLHFNNDNEQRQNSIKGGGHTHKSPALTLASGKTSLKVRHGSIVHVCKTHQTDVEAGEVCMCAPTVLTTIENSINKEP